MVYTFPSLPGLSIGIQRSSALNSIRHRATSGRRTIVPQQSIPIWTWSLPYNFLRSAQWDANVSWTEFETLVGFFNSRAVDGYAFQYTDPDDGSCTLAGFGTGDGVSTQFQLYRSLGGFSEPVYAPSGVSDIQVGGVSTAAYTVSDLGVVTFTSAPGSGQALTWSGTYNWLCRFEQDTFEMERVLMGLYSAGSALKFSNEINP